ncbi:MAG: tyrosine-type recombinase/integrase [Deferribacterales bacterium]
MAQVKTKTVRVRKDKNRLLLDFYYRDVRCREYLSVTANKEGRRYAERQAKLLEQQILDGDFEYAAWFPNSKKCRLFNSVADKANKTFAEVADEWREQVERLHKAGELKRTTLRNYMNSLKSINQYFANYEMQNITKSLVDDYKFELLDKPLSKKSINNKLTPLRRIFDYAYEQGYIEHNVMDRVKNFTLELPEIEPFNQLEVQAILNHLQKNNPKFHAMFTILFHTGMRIGEVLAMKWKNFDEMFCSYHVKEHFTEKRLDTPKTKASKRIVPLTDEAMNALRNHKQYTFMKSDFIFCNQYGDPWVSSDNIMKQVWEPMLKKLGIAYRIIYQCRHTHASLSILAGDNLAHIAERMGHKNVGTLITRYAKYVKSVQFQQPKIGSFLSNSGHDLQSGGHNLSEYCQNQESPITN